jgi:lipopolysaccharide/colanic/teichoic acid biosynthesis glycosyltransferase
MGDGGKSCLDRDLCLESKLLQVRTMTPSEQPMVLPPLDDEKPGSLPGVSSVGEGFERILAIAIMLALLPLFLFVTILVFAIQGRPIFYSGERIGRRGRSFNIKKFRTLALDAESRLHGTVLGARSNLETPLGRYLRVTRIDELPQLWNIAAGEMSFFGPRPARRAVLLEQGGSIAGVLAAPPFKPGLIGPVQLYMPHGASKRIRYAFLRRIYLTADVHKLSQLGLAVLCATAMSVKIFEVGRDCAARLGRTRSAADRRQSFRIAPPRPVQVYVGDKAGPIYAGKVLDIDDHAFSLKEEGVQIHPGQQIDLVVRAKKSGRWRTYHAYGRVTSIASIPPVCDDGDPRRLVFFDHVSDAGQYVVERYILRKSIL